MNFSDFEDLKEINLDPSMYELFCVEIENQCLALNNGLINLEKNSQDYALLESLMRAAHSIKGAARVVNLNPIVKLAHAIEDYFVAAQNKTTDVNSEKIDQLLQSVDLLNQLAKLPIERVHHGLQEQFPQIKALIEKILDFHASESEAISGSQKKVLLCKKGKVKKSTSNLLHKR